ncbi:MAG: glycosyltransferase family 39 protein [Anaerolineae bacterium]|nr:glycosyltransferase family 39 protein [Anaerolineae bacterium]
MSVQSNNPNGRKPRQNIVAHSAQFARTDHTEEIAAPPPAASPSDSPEVVPPAPAARPTPPQKTTLPLPGRLSFSQRPVAERINRARTSWLQREPPAPAGATMLNVFMQPEQHSQVMITAEHGLLVLLLSLILFVRLANLTFNTLYLDEAIYTTVGEEALHGVFDQGATRWMFGSYLYPAVATVAEHIGGVVGLRALSAVLMTIAAVFVYLTAHKVFGGRASLFALFIFGLTGVSINLGQHAVYDALGVPLAAASLYCVVAAVLNPEQQRRYLLWGGVTFSVGVLAKYIGLLTFPTLIVIMLALHLSQGRGLFSFITRVSWASFLIPIVIMLGIYAAFYRMDLPLVFTGQFASQADSRGAILLEIVQDIGIPILLALAAIPIIAQEAYNHLCAEHPVVFGVLTFLLPIVVVAVLILPIYHLITANIRSLWKHEIYALVFIAPLAGYGIAKMIEALRAIGGRLALPVRLISAAVTIIGIVWFVSYAFTQNGLFHHSWPTAQPSLDFLRSQHIGPQSRVLSSSYAIYDYYFNFGVRDQQVWNNVWYVAYDGLTGPDAARKAIQDCAFDVIVLDNYYAPDLVRTLEPVVVQSGYILKFNTDKSGTQTITGTRAYTSEGCRGIVI